MVSKNNKTFSPHDKLVRLIREAETSVPNLLWVPVLVLPLTYRTF